MQALPGKPNELAHQDAKPGWIGEDGLWFPGPSDGIGEGPVVGFGGIITKLVIFQEKNLRSSTEVITDPPPTSFGLFPA
jgi:hypothetical protein